jgi:hypothetical protein
MKSKSVKSLLPPPEEPLELLEDELPDEYPPLRLSAPASGAGQGHGCMKQGDAGRDEEDVETVSHFGVIPSSKRSI